MSFWHRFQNTMDFASDICAILVTVLALYPYTILDRIVPGQDNNLARDSILVFIGFILFSPITIPLYCLSKLFALLASI